MGVSSEDSSSPGAEDGELAAEGGGRPGLRCCTASFFKHMCLFCLAALGFSTRYPFSVTRDLTWGALLW